MKLEGVPGEVVVHKDDPDGCRGRTRVHGTRAPLDLADVGSYTCTKAEYYGALERATLTTNRGMLHG